MWKVYLVILVGIALETGMFAALGFSIGWAFLLSCLLIGGVAFYGIREATKTIGFNDYLEETEKRRGI